MACQVIATILNSPSIEDNSVRSMKKENVPKGMAKAFNRIERLQHIKKETARQKTSGWDYSGPSHLPQTRNPLAEARNVLNLTG